MLGILTSPDGLPVIGIIVGWIGDPEVGEQYLKPLREFDTPLVDLIGKIPYTQLQKLLDGAVPHGLHRYAKMGYLPHLKDDLLQVIIDHSKQITSPFSAVLLNCIKGAVTKIDPDETPFVYRNEQWHFDIVAQWTDPSQADQHISWAHSFWEDSERFTKGTGINFFDADDGHDRVKLAYGPNYSRLAKLKHKYDPENFFRMNNNILPNPNG